MTGRIATLGYLPALAATPALRLVAVADPAPDRRLALAAASGTAPSTHDGPEALIGAGGVEALIVAGPAESHLEHARLAAEARLACLVEKPPAPTLAAARA
ncbi:MAG: inositol 2-dehydrogenase, partial [Solirubrobacterales bacterium]|nr:inositol 2-dehydrogenase [Solirubrobacterales bacterium]